MQRVERLKLINSVCGIRGVHLIGSRSNDNVSNLAIFSSVTHLGSNPSLLGFICRPSKEVKRDTLTNILSNKFYTINRFIRKLKQYSLNVFNIIILLL